MDEMTRVAPDFSDAPEEVSISDIAQRTGLTVMAVRLWVTDGRLPAHKVGRRWMIRRDNVVQLLREQPHLGRPHRPRRAERLALEKVERRAEPFDGRSTGILESGLL